MYTCIHLHVYMHANIKHVHIYRHAYVHLYIYIYTQNTYTQIYTYTYVCRHSYAYINSCKRSGASIDKHVFSCWSFTLAGRQAVRPTKTLCHTPCEVASPVQSNSDCATLQANPPLLNIGSAQLSTQLLAS